MSFLSVLERVWGWQPAGLMEFVGASLRLYVGNLHVLWGVFGATLGLNVGNLQVLWVCGASLGLYVGNLGNLHVLWGVLEPVCGCILQVL